MRLLIMFSGFAGIIVLLFLTRPGIQADLRETPIQVVDAIAVEQRDIRNTRRIAGKLQPSHTASLRFEVAGRIKNRNVEPGQKVSAGQVLLEIDADDYTDTVIEMRALLDQELRAIERDRTLLELEEKETVLLQRELERLALLQQQSLASQSRYDETEQKLIRQQAEVARLQHSVATATSRRRQREATLKRAERDLDRTRLVAPFDAIVNRVLPEKGDYTTSGQQAVELVQVRELDVYLEVPGGLAEYLALDQAVEVSAEGARFTGKILALAFDPDPTTNTHALRVRVDGDGLYPGKIVQVELPGRFYPGAKLIPVTAALDEHGENYVFVISRGLLSKQPIRIIENYGDLRIIEGIDSGTVIVERDVAVYDDGQKIVVKQP